MITNIKNLDEVIEGLKGTLLKRAVDNNNILLIMNKGEPVEDYLGNEIWDVDETGYCCAEKELVHKRNLHRCLECFDSYSTPHIKFVDGDWRKPLCKRHNNILNRRKYSNKTPVKISKILYKYSFIIGLGNYFLQAGNR